MKTTILSCVLLVWSSTAMQSKNTGDPKFIFIKKDKGISIYYRWIKVNEKLKVRELKAEFDINSSPENIIALLKNDKLAIEWMKGTSEINKLDKPSENQWHTYILYNIPWPLSNQDCIVHYEVKRETPGNSYLILMNGMPAFIPEIDGVTRIRHLQGVWKLSPSGKTICKVIYTVNSKQASKFPRIITDPIIQGNLINSMEAFKRIAETQN